MRDNITLCLTIGKRPDELKQTLQSLLSKVQFKYIIAINDFGDGQTNAVFYELCPQGQLINLGYNLGHHQAVDLMYGKITTPYIFHCEDDWIFDTAPNIDEVIQLLENDDTVVSVSLRQLSDFNFSNEEFDKIEYIDSPHLSHAKLNALHEQWHGYTFNPHITKLETYQQIAPLSKFKKERHISRYLRQSGKYVAYLKQGACHHIGFDSVANPPNKTWFAKIKAKLFG